MTSRDTLLPNNIAQAAALILIALLGTAWADEAPEKLIAQGHYKRARPIVEAQLTSNPGDARAQYLLSRIELEMGNVDAALPLAEKAVAAEPSNSAYHVQLAEVVGVMADEASLLSQISLSRRFKKEIDLAVALDPKNTEALFDLMRYYVRAPAFFGGDKKKAHALASQIATVDPVKGAFAFVHLAKTDEEPEKIEGMLRAAVDARPNDYVARAALAEYYFKHGPLDRAEEHAKAADLLDRDRTRACLLRAAIHLRREQWNEMEGTLSECEKRVPDDLSPYYRIATMLNARRQELPRAERYLRRYLTQEPEGRRASLALAWWRLGQNLQKQSRDPEAIAAYERSLELDSDSPAAKSLKRSNPAARESGHRADYRFVGAALAQRGFVVAIPGSTYVVLREVSRFECLNRRLLKPEARVSCGLQCADRVPPARSERATLRVDKTTTGAVHSRSDGLARLRGELS